MAFAAPTKNKQVTTNLAKSTWTPMNNSEANLQVFEERRTIIKKWFEKWGDKQRRNVIEDIFKSLSEKQLLAVHRELTLKFPEEKFDFTKRLPRVLSLYIFSFLDPRSLCRCAQVSWYWKYLTELDCVWRPKCLRFGWYPTHQPSPFEETIWKRHYVETIFKLNYVKAKKNTVEGTEQQPETARTDRTQMSSARSNISSASTARKKAHVAPKSVPIPGPKWEPPPWKGSDPHPTDTFRYNYLNNSQNTRGKSKNPRRPKSAAGSMVSTARKSMQGPVKSTYEPRPSSAAQGNSSSVTQSFDPQSLATTQQSAGGGVHPTASARNMMSASVSNFAYAGGTQGSPGTHTSMNGGGTLNASTYYMNNTGSPQRSLGGTLDASTYYANVSGGYGASTTPTSSPHQNIKFAPTSSPLAVKDASQRPQPVTRLSTDKSLDLGSSRKMKENIPSPSKAEPMSPPKQVAGPSDYQIKSAGLSSGKATPLQGNPWKPPENVSDDD